MYNIPEGEISFLDVEDFCLEEHEEDLILDYKADWPNDLGRILCGMANVQGGMVLIGVNTQPGSRKPAWPPLGVEGDDDSLRQRVIQVAYDGIYPPVFPQVDIVRLENDATRAIIVIRVDASRLLHATDQRRRVYVRVRDHSRGVHNDLASLSQLEWLFQQRQKSIELRETIVKRAAERAVKQFSKADHPILTIFTAPVFPRKYLPQTPAEIKKTANRIGLIGPSQRRVGITIPASPQWRTTSEGAYVLQDDREDFPQYIEVSSHGLIYLEQVIPTYSDAELPDARGFMLVRAATIILVCEAYLNFAAKIYEVGSWLGPMKLSASLKNMDKFHLDARPSVNSFSLAGYSSHLFSQDDIITIHDGEFQARNLGDHCDEILQVITCNLLWAFGYPDNREELVAYATRILK